MLKKKFLKRILVGTRSSCAIQTTTVHFCVCFHFGFYFNLAVLNIKRVNKDKAGICTMSSNLRRSPRVGIQPYDKSSSVRLIHMFLACMVYTRMGDIFNLEISIVGVENELGYLPWKSTS